MSDALLLPPEHQAESLQGAVADYIGGGGLHCGDTDRPVVRVRDHAGYDLKASTN